MERIYVTPAPMPESSTLFYRLEQVPSPPLDSQIDLVGRVGLGPIPYPLSIYGAGLYIAVGGPSPYPGEAAGLYV